MGSEMCIRDRFCRLCQEKGVSPTRATVEIGLSRTIGTKWKKTGATPQGDTLQKIADYFGVSVDYLLGNEKSPANTSEDDILDEIDVGFYGEYKELDDDDKEAVRDFVRVMRERRAKKKQE